METFVSSSSRAFERIGSQATLHDLIDVGQTLDDSQVGSAPAAEAAYVAVSGAPRRLFPSLMHSQATSPHIAINPDIYIFGLRTDCFCS